MLGTSPVGGATSGEAIAYDLPGTVTRYLSANGSQWTGSFSEADADGMPLTWMLSEYRTYRAGRPHAERWNGAVFGPSFSDSSWAVRDTDGIRTGISLFGDAAGHVEALGEVATASTKLFRNGQLVAESDRPGLLRATGLPGERAGYRLTATASRDTKFALSTRTDAAWTLRSGGADDGPLPLWAVRFQPRLDASNTGSPRWVPITVQAQPDAAVGRLKGLTVAVSGDDGTTWQPAKAARTGKNSWLARVTVPAGSAYVSFRAMAADSQGNTVEQTVIRGYRLG